MEAVLGLDRVKKKVQSILEWFTSKIIKNIQKFLTLANYYKIFVKNFAKIIKSLYTIMIKNQKYC